MLSMFLDIFNTFIFFQTILNQFFPLIYTNENSLKLFKIISIIEISHFNNILLYLLI